jgi:hypothetical protein
LLPKLGVDINNLNLSSLGDLLSESGITDEQDFEDDSDIVLILALLAAADYTFEQLRELIPDIQIEPRPELDPNAANTANPGLDEAIDQLLRDNRIPGIAAIPNPDFDPNNINQPGSTPVIPLPDTGNRNPELPDVTDRFDHRIIEEDVTTGPHGPDRPIEDVVARARKIDPVTGRANPQGRWLSRGAAERAIANLDVTSMIPGQAYSVPIEPDGGVVIRAYNEYPPTDTPPSDRYIVDSADRAIVILQKGGIHTYPIGSDNRAYNNPAPIK